MALLFLLVRFLRRRARVHHHHWLLQRPAKIALQVVVAGEAHAGDDQSKQEAFHRRRLTVPCPLTFCLFGKARLPTTVRAMKVLKEFKEFINKGNVVDLAVAVVIGGAFGKIVSALVADLVMPLVNAAVPQGDWRKWEVTPLHFRVGDFMGTLVDFTIVAFVVFIIMVKVVGTVNRKAAATKACPECLETVPLVAKRCRACTSVLTVFALMLLAAPASAQPNPTFT